jgi:hypothetical protein
MATLITAKPVVVQAEAPLERLSRASGTRRDIRSGDEVRDGRHGDDHDPAERD